MGESEERLYEQGLPHLLRRSGMSPDQFEGGLEMPYNPRKPQ